MIPFIKRHKRLLPVLGLVTVLLVLGLWQRFSPKPVHFGNTPVACIPDHENLVQHFHAVVNIAVDGVPETIPANVGIKSNCMAEVHTHDASGEVHVESLQAEKQFRLGDFFAVWGQSITRPGYNLQLLVNGQNSTSGGNVVLQDDQRIELHYTKK